MLLFSGFCFLRLWFFLQRTNEILVNELMSKLRVGKEAISSKLQNKKAAKGGWQLNVLTAICQEFKTHKDKTDKVAV